MIEYPSIKSYLEVPHGKSCYVFEKIDGSNIRVKWDRKTGFTEFGTRHETLTKDHPHLGKAIDLFNTEFAKPVNNWFMNQKGINEGYCFLEYAGKNSFAGIHNLKDKHELTLFDIMLVRKNVRKFLLPQDFVDQMRGIGVTIPGLYANKVLNDELIDHLKTGNWYNETNPMEGFVIKGTEPSGAFAGGVWMCKIKTVAYLEKLKKSFGDNWQKYGE